jgi:hypothetical protein
MAEMIRLCTGLPSISRAISWISTPDPWLWPTRTTPRPWLSCARYSFQASTTS